MMMSKLSSFTVPEGQKEERIMFNEEIVKFKYPAVFPYRYRYIGKIENNHYLMHDYRTRSQIILQSTWEKIWLTIQVFSLFVVRTEVNSYLAMKYLLNNDETFMIV